MLKLCFCEFNVILIFIHIKYYVLVCYGKYNFFFNFVSESVAEHWGSDEMKSMLSRLQAVGWGCAETVAIQTPSSVRGVKCSNKTNGITKISNAFQNIKKNHSWTKPNMVNILYNYCLIYGSCKYRHVLYVAVYWV